MINVSFIVHDFISVYSFLLRCRQDFFSLNDVLVVWCLRDNYLLLWRWTFVNAIINELNRAFIPSITVQRCLSCASSQECGAQTYLTLYKQTIRAPKYSSTEQDGLQYMARNDETLTLKYSVFILTWLSWSFYNFHSCIYLGGAGYQYRVEEQFISWLKKNELKELHRNFPSLQSMNIM